MAASIATAPVFRPERPQALGALNFGTSEWDVSADGKRFIGTQNAPGTKPYTVVLNWQAGLKK